MQPCNIATGAACNYTNTAATFPTSEIVCSGVGVSQHYCSSLCCEFALSRAAKVRVLTHLHCCLCCCRGWRLGVNDLNNNMICIFLSSALITVLLKDIYTVHSEPDSLAHYNTTCRTAIKQACPKWQAVAKTNKQTTQSCTGAKLNQIAPTSLQQYTNNTPTYQKPPTRQPSLVGGQVFL